VVVAKLSEVSPVTVWKFTDVSDQNTVSISRTEEYAEEIRLKIEATGFFETSVNSLIVAERR
jgi:hypothetical protein